MSNGLTSVVVVCDACDSLLGNVIVNGDKATWQPHQPMRRDQRAEFLDVYPEGLPAVRLDGSTTPQAYCPNGHAGFDTSPRNLRSAVELSYLELRLAPEIV